MATNPSSALKKSYEGRRADYIAFTKALKQILTDLLASKSAEYLTIESRTKTRASFAEKIGREVKQGKYRSLEDITDITGIRIVTFLKEDRDSICQLVSDNFQVDNENSIDKNFPVEVDRFGYSSSHMVITLSKSRSTLPELARFKGLKAEVQIRTVLQHAWAVLDWRFRYKTEHEAPREVRRKLFRIAAFLEGADENFSEVNKEVYRLRESYDERIKAGNLDIEINSESLAGFLLDESKFDAKYKEAIKDGFLAFEDNPDRIGNFVEGLYRVDITTVGRLQEVIEAFPFSIGQLKDAAKKSLDEDGVQIRFVELGRAALARMIVALSAENDDDFLSRLTSLYKGQEAIELLKRINRELKL